MPFPHFKRLAGLGTQDFVFDSVLMVTKKSCRNQLYDQLAALLHTAWFDVIKSTGALKTDPNTFFDKIAAKKTVHPTPQRLQVCQIGPSILSERC